ncbi:MAG: Maf family protein [Planctomycetaceae bacterium]|nr:Maf family protein [Planctomycetaceae bacterium]
MNSSPAIVLGSRSPRRLALLRQVTGDIPIEICPPLDSEEPGFEGLSTDNELEQRLLKIVAMKFNDVTAQVEQRTDLSDPAILVADTIVIAKDKSDHSVVLGQPDPDRWRHQVFDWMSELLSGTTHSVWTGLMVSRAGQTWSHIVRTEVSFVPLNDELIRWYISTGESPGKAGGYAIQGHAQAFVCGISGSLTSVIGLPVLEVVQALQSVNIRIPATIAGNHDGAGNA